VADVDAGCLLIRRCGHVVVLTLNRPEQLNAIDDDLKRALAAAWAGIGADTTVRAVVLHANGRAFCTGADMSRLAESDRGAGPRPQYPPAAYTARQAEIYKPVVVAVNGLCVGGGLHFVADADIVIASEQAEFLDTHVNVGQVAGLEPISLVPRIGLTAVLRMVLLGKSERISAPRALAMGLVSEVVAADDLLDRACALAERIAAASPAAVQGSLRAIWGSERLGSDLALRKAWDIIVDHWGHPDAAEGPQALIEKRSPQWSS
jgi:enoyl-CoA hydratase/carnithine racemase